ncbi:hypothetical protein BGX34_002859, partial [Mortierella sp. NVP85]
KRLTRSWLPTQILEPLRQIALLPPQDDSQATIATMRSLGMGLIGFDHITHYMILDFDFVPRVASSHPSCRAVQVLYDSYLGQVKSQIGSKVLPSDE